MDIPADSTLLTPGAYVLRVFGGQRKLSRQLGISVWVAHDLKRSTRSIARPLAVRLLDVAELRGLDLTSDDLIFGRWLLPTGEAVSARGPAPALPPDSVPVLSGPPRRTSVRGRPGGKPAPSAPAPHKQRAASARPAVPVG